MPTINTLSRDLFAKAADMAEAPDRFWGPKVTQPELKLAVGVLEVDGSLDAKDRVLVRDRFADSDLSRSARGIYDSIIGVPQPSDPVPPSDQAMLLAWEAMPAIYKQSVLMGERVTAMIDGVRVEVPAGAAQRTSIPESELPQGIRDKIEAASQAEYSPWDSMDYDGPVPAWDKYRFDEVVDVQSVSLAGEHVGYVVELMPNAVVTGDDDYDSHDEPGRMFFAADGQSLGDDFHGYPV